nr:MAG TPA: hypothetical protein [Caudoviricetes sp.]
MTGWEMFFMIVGVATVAAIPLRIVDRMDRR